MENTEKHIFDVRFSSLHELEHAFNDQISKGGYFIASDEPAPRTTPVMVNFHLPGLPEPIAVDGEVAFAATSDQPMPGMGAGMAIQFADLSAQIKRAFSAAITIARKEGFETASTAELEGKEWGGEDDLEEDGDAGEDEKEEYEEEEESEESSRSFLARLSQQSGENLYFTIRGLPMHQKITAAKRGNRTVRNILLQEGNKKIIGFILQNPQLSTPEIIQMLKMPNLPQEVVKNIARNSNFSQSEEVRFQIVNSPKTPLPLALNLLNGLNINSLAKLAKSGAVKNQIKSSALKLLEQRRKNS